MATRAFTNVSTAIAPGGVVPNAWDDSGLIVGYYRIQNGTAGDTVTVPASDFNSSDIRFACGGGVHATNALSASQANTQVVFTLNGTPASTAIAFDILLVGKRNT